MTAIKIHSVKYNFLMNLLLSGSSVIFPLITFPIVSRALYSDMYGLCNWSFSIASWLSLIAMLGVSKYGIREVARNRNEPISLAKTTSEILTFTLATTSFILICFIISIFIIPDLAAYRELFLVNSITILCNTLGVNWFFQGIEQYNYITLRGIAIKIVCFIGVIAFVHTPDDYLIYALLIVLSAALANLINFAYMAHLLKQTLKAHDASLPLISIFSLNFSPLRHLKPLLVFFIIAAAISIYTVLDTVMLGFLSTTQQVGFYSAAINVKNALVSVVSALSGVLLPRASNMLINGRKDEYRSLIKKSICLVLCVSIPLALILAFLSTPLITWYAGNDFVGAGAPLSILALSIIPIGLSVIFCDAVLIPNGLEKYCTVIYLIAAVVNFASNIILIPSLGAFGAAISTFFVECLIAVFEFIFARKLVWS